MTEVAQLRAQAAEQRRQAAHCSRSGRSAASSRPRARRGGRLAAASSALEQAQQLAQAWLHPWHCEAVALLNERINLAVQRQVRAAMLRVARSTHRLRDPRRTLQRLQSCAQLPSCRTKERTEMNRHSRDCRCAYAATVHGSRRHTPRARPACAVGEGALPPRGRGRRTAALPRGAAQVRVPAGLHRSMLHSLHLSGRLRVTHGERHGLVLQIEQQHAQAEREAHAHAHPHTNHQQ